MSQDKSRLEEAISALKQQRDELVLKVHLGAADAKDEFAAATKKLDKMTEDYQPLKDAVAESTGNLLSSLQLVGEEVLASFDRIRKSL